MKAVALLALWPGVVAAQDLSLPGNAERTLARTEAQVSFALPVGPWQDGEVPTRVIVGAQSVEVWRIAARSLDPGVILASLRDQLIAKGFTVALDCAAQTCGGFDFRFAIPVEPAPEMVVDLGAFHFLSATSDDGAVAILASRTPQAGTVQITRIAPDATALDTGSSDAPVLRAAITGTGALADALDTDGHAVLNGVDFGTGETDLAQVPVPSLQALAAHLQANPDLAVSIVGHTDATGSLEGNIALSRQRAAAVVERLVADYGMPRAQLTPAGMGYLSPVASNLTDAGRAANRRVEAVITGRR